MDTRKALVHVMTVTTPSHPSTMATLHVRMRRTRRAKPGSGRGANAPDRAHIQGQTGLADRNPARPVCVLRKEVMA